jgi:hypothetical protein
MEGETEIFGLVAFDDELAGFFGEVRGEIEKEGGETARKSEVGIVGVMAV